MIQTYAKRSHGEKSLVIFAQKRKRASKRNQGWAQWAVLVAQVIAAPRSTRLQIDWRKPGPMLKYDAPPPFSTKMLFPVGEMPAV